MVLYNKDPGSSGLTRKFPFEQVNNVNREIVSTSEGIKKTSRKYVLKLRSDMLLKGNGFLEYYSYFMNALPEDADFKQRIMVDAKNTYDSCICFYIGDWWSFGLKEDMLLLWNVNLFPYNGKLDYYLKKKNAQKKPYGSDLVSQYKPEQWMPYQCYLKNHELKFEHAYDRNGENSYFAIKFLKDNFLTIEPCFSGIILPKTENVINTTPNQVYYNYKKQLKNLKEYKISLPLLTKLKYEIIYQLNKVKRRSPLEYIYIIRNFAKPKDSVEIKVDKIKQEEVTFVVSGLPDEQAEKSLKSIRKYYPKSKIILSIQSNIDISKLEGLYDKLVESPIRDEYLLDRFAVLNNRRRFTYNKQQEEIHNGLKEVDTKYAVRFRLDYKIKTSKLFEMYENYCKIYSKTLGQYRLFDKKVLVSDYFTGNISQNQFYLSDCFAFGLTCDLLKLYNGTFMDAETLDFYRNPENKKLPNPASFSHKYTCEQTLFFSLINYTKKTFDMPKTYCDFTTDQVMLFEKYLTSNFISAPFVNLKIDTKFPYVNLSEKYLERYILYTEPLNEKLDKLYLKNLRLIKNKKKLEKYKGKLKKHCNNFIHPIKSIVLYISEPVNILFYMMKLVVQGIIFSFR